MVEIKVALIGLLSGLLGGIFSKLSSDRRNYLEHITQERREWRDTIRSLTEELYGDKPNYNLIRSKYEIRLNPSDDEDNKILAKLDELIAIDYMKRSGYNCESRKS